MGMRYATRWVRFVPDEPEEESEQGEFGEVVLSRLEVQGRVDVSSGFEGRKFRGPSLLKFKTPSWRGHGGLAGATPKYEALCRKF